MVIEVSPEAPGAGLVKEFVVKTYLARCVRRLAENRR